MKTILLFLTSVYLFSCDSISDREIEFMRSVYRPVLEAKIKRNVSKVGKISFSARQMKIKDFAVWFSDKYNVGFIYQATYAGALIDLELKNATIIDVCNAVARHLNTEVVSLGNAYFVGSQKSSDKGVLVKKVRGVSVKDLRSIVSSFTGSEGDQQGYVTEDGIVFLLDKEQNLQPILRALDQLEATEKRAWIVQLYLIEYDREEAKSYGIDLSASGSLAFNLLSDSINPVGPLLDTASQVATAPAAIAGQGLKYDVVLDGLIDFSSRTDSIRIVGQNLCVMRDGLPYSFSNVISVPFIKRVSTESGNVEDQDVTFIDTGMTIDIKLREMLQGSLLSLKFSNSKILEIDSSGLPIRSIVNVNSDVPLKNTGVYLLAQTDYMSKGQSDSYFHKGKKTKKSTLQIFARVYKIDKNFLGLKQDLTAKNFSGAKADE